jgi:hypothetical protein
LEAIDKGGDITLFSFPLEAESSLGWNNFYGISNYVDQVAGGSIGDYNCGNRTYNGHAGTDFFTWPFGHYLKQNDLVSVIAAAPGTIVGKLDGHADEQCNLNPNLTWNAVYVEHADGSVAWYGHLKEGSLTTKAIGETVQLGEYLGIVASSGFSSGPHLHFEVHAPGGGIIDPYAGECNDLNVPSWWTEQDVYTEMQLNTHLTHDAPPLLGCPSANEATNFQNEFNNLETVYFASYWKDQDPDVIATYTIRDPFGGVYSTWTHQSAEYYSASWWWWNLQMPTIGGEGEWTYNISFNGESHDHYFYLVSPTVGLEEEYYNEFAIGPNPVIDFLKIRGEKRIDELRVYNMNGQLILQESNIQNGLLDVRSLSKGLYAIEIMSSGERALQSFIKD